MASNKKHTNDSSMIFVTIISILLCSGGLAIGLNVLGPGIFSPSNSVASTVGSAPQATATAVQDDIAPPGGFGTAPAPIPTFDVSQVEKLPTTIPPPELPTLVPDSQEEGEAPSSGTIEIIHPDGTLKKYSNADIDGFSFEYPSNWKIEETINKSPRDFFVDIIIENYTITGFPKGLPLDGTFKLEIQITPDFEQYENINSWFAHYQDSLKDPNESASNPSFPNTKDTMIDGVPAIRWSGSDFGGYQEVAFGKNKWLYTVVAYSRSDAEDVVFERILSSFRVP